MDLVASQVNDRHKDVPSGYCFGIALDLYYPEVFLDSYSATNYAINLSYTINCISKYDDVSYEDAKKFYYSGQRDYKQCIDKFDDDS